MGVARGFAVYGYRLRRRRCFGMRMIVGVIMGVIVRVIV
jgi:hypothetical protein